MAKLSFGLNKAQKLFVSKGKEVMEIIYSKTGDGQDRTTFHNDDGTIREVTDCKDGGTTVVDTDQAGNKSSGPGVAGLTGSHAGVVRTNP